MQLFAIVANVDDENDTSRSFVRLFLNEELDANQTENYLKIYDDYIQQHHFRRRAKDGAVKRTSRNSVKMLRIAAEINKSLSRPQKQIALLRLVEYVYSRDISTPENREFIDVISDAFNIESSAFESMLQFVRYKEVPANSPNLLEVSKTLSNASLKHLERSKLKGSVIFLYLKDSGLLAFKKLGDQSLYMSGNLLKQDRVYLMQKGSAIKSPELHSIYFSDVLLRFTQDNISSPIHLQVESIEYKFPNGNIGIQSISFTSSSGKLAGIMGGSGTGKSTLLSILNGSSAPSGGRVLINGFDLYTESEKLQGLIGFVPQDDLLMEDLTVWQNLFYSAKLSFGSLSNQEIKLKVEKTLKELGLFEIRQLKVGSPIDKSISGGQRKRLNIALELIREPSILFVDEPTSGLSSRDSEKIMDLLKGLTLKGCLVFAVIHQPSSEIFRQFDQLVVLDKGGYLVFEGNPIDGLNYFREASDQVLASDAEYMVNAEQIFDILEVPIVDEFGEFTDERKVKSKEWASRFEQHRKLPKNIKPSRKVADVDYKVPNSFVQFKVFVIRDVLGKLANMQYLSITMLEMPVLATIIAGFLRYWGDEGYVYRDNSNILAYTFISIIVALFIGLSISAEEIIKDRSIRKRESFLNLSWGGYLNSKIAILFSVSAIQILLYVLVGNTILGIKGMYFSYWLVLFSAAALANIVGLIISASFKKVVTIYILIPFIIIPQIMFSGLLVKYERLNPWFSSQKEVPWIGDIMASRWLFEALAVNQSVNNEFDKYFFNANVMLAHAKFKKNFWIPEMEAMLLYLENQLKNEQNIEGTSGRANTIYNELVKLPSKLKEHLKFDIECLKNGTYKQADLYELALYIELLKDYYGRSLKSAVNKKDILVANLQERLPETDSFNDFRNQYQNKQLNEYLNSKTSLTRIITYKNEIINKSNQTFQVPTDTNPHYYASLKLFNGRLYSVLYYNLVVIWIATAVLGMALYFKLLPRLLNWKK